MKLLYKGLFFIAFILLVQLGFVFALLQLLNQAEATANREAQAKLIVGHTNKLMHTYYDAANTLKEYFMSRDDKSRTKYEAVLNKVPKEIHWLRINLKGDKDARAELIKIEKKSDKILSILKEAKKTADEESILSAIPKLSEFRADIQPLFEGIVIDADKLIKEQEKILETNPARQAAARAEIRNILYAGIASNIAIAFFLVTYFMGNIVRRLDILMDNTKRLSSSEELRPLLKGSDEISQLDGVFHEMADALAKARRVEKESEARIRQIIESMPVGVLVALKSGRIEFSNPMAERMFEYDGEALADKHLSELLSFKSEMDEEKMLLQLTESGDGKMLELSGIRANQTEFPVELTCELYRSFEGMRLLVIVLDTTEKYELLKLRRSFVSMVSHELRTPLTSIQSFLGMLNMGIYGELPEQVLKLGGGAERSTNQLIRLINELLDVEKMEQGKLEMRFGPATVAEVVEGAREATSGYLEKYSVTLAEDLADIDFIGDGERISQVLINFISNAAKFSPQDSQIKLEVEEQSEEIVFRVIDKGRGVPEQYRQVVFERFQQVEEGDSKELGGTGLGLAICKTIVENHGGTIGVDSTVGEGSTFWFRIPKVSRS